jgi:TolB-like protein/tetratricopeptide (TPR) repeat protein
LRKGSSSVHLPPQPARVLALLAGRPRELVTRGELREQVWGGDTYVEFDQALNFCIRKIRAALGDDAEAPRYIETLARRGYRFIAPVQEEAGPVVATAERVMLAVLPFENLSRDPEQGYFSDGLTEEMITHLGRLNPQRLGVIARTSSMRYKGAARSVAEIGRELGVQYLLEGSVRISKARLRVSAQLIRAGDQTHLWAESYDRPLRDILAVQAEVARSIAGQIRLKLTPEESVRLQRTRAVVPDSYQAYLRGLVHMNQSSGEACKNCLACFEQALRADPGFAPAHAALSLTWARMGFHGLLAPREAWRKAREAARRAIEIDDECADGHAALARVELEFEWDWEKAERESLRALELNPNHTTAHHWLSHLHVALRRLDESLVTSRRAVELDPFDPGIHAHLAWHYIHARQYEDAISQSRRTLELDPNNVSARIHLGWALLQDGASDAAVAELKEAASPGRGENNEALWSLGHACAVAGEARRAREILRELSGRRCRASFGKALIHLGLGEADEALKFLDEALDERCVQMIYLRLDPRLDRLRSDPRFVDLARRVGLPG